MNTECLKFLQEAFNKYLNLTFLNSIKLKYNDLQNGDLLLISTSAFVEILSEYEKTNELTCFCEINQFENCNFKFCKSGIKDNELIGLNLILNKELKKFEEQFLFLTEKDMGTNGESNEMKKNTIKDNFGKIMNFENICEKCSIFEWRCLFDQASNFEELNLVGLFTLIFITQNNIFSVDILEEVFTKMKSYFQMLFFLRNKEKLTSIQNWFESEYKEAIFSRFRIQNFLENELLEIKSLDKKKPLELRFIYDTEEDNFTIEWDSFELFRCRENGFYFLIIEEHNRILDRAFFTSNPLLKILPIVDQTDPNQLSNLQYIEFVNKIWRLKARMDEGYFLSNFLPKFILKTLISFTFDQYKFNFFFKSNIFTAFLIFRMGRSVLF